MPAAKGSARTPLGPILKIVATYVYANSQGQRTHSARTNLMASLAPARAEVEAGVVAKADQQKSMLACLVWVYSP